MFKMKLLMLIAAIASACSVGAMEKEFFKGDPQTRVERLRGYSLDEQWRIFVYGNQVVHPPIRELAIPIAERGKEALRFILRELEDSRGDLNFRDSMVVFEKMQKKGYYDVCADDSAMERIRKNEEKIEYRGWRELYREMAYDLCNESQMDDSNGEGV